MEINEEKVYERLPKQITDLIQLALSKPATVKCTVTRIAEDENKNETRLTIIIDTPTWYSKLTK